MGGHTWGLRAPGAASPGEAPETAAGRPDLLQAQAGLPPPLPPCLANLPAVPPPPPPTPPLAQVLVRAAGSGAAAAQAPSAAAAVPGPSPSGGAEGPAIPAAVLAPALGQLAAAVQRAESAVSGADPAGALEAARQLDQLWKIVRPALGKFGGEEPGEAAGASASSSSLAPEAPKSTNPFGSGPRANALTETELARQSFT
mmetsp:Transcript_65282/g.147249  ORF Transcript_65282/g.147249 Transcript_65282/m.147249 type:complete len:200 (+) Transcript_65282:1007-1606(+)